MLGEEPTARWISPSGEPKTGNVTVTPSISANPCYITLLRYGRMLTCVRGLRYTACRGTHRHLWAARLYSILGAFAKLRKQLLASSCLSVGPHVTTRLPLDGFSWNFIFGRFSKNCPQKFKFHSNRRRIKGTLHEDHYTFFTTSRSVFLRNVSDKGYRGNQNTYFAFNNFFENRPVYEIMWKNNVEPGRAQMTIWRMSTASWIPKDTDTHTHTHTHTIRSTYCFSTTTMVARRRLNVTWYVHCQSCFHIISQTARF